MACEHVLPNCSKCTDERDSLSTRVRELEGEVERLRRSFADASAISCQRDVVLHAALAECERMRPVFEAAKAWHLALECRPGIGAQVALNADNAEARLWAAIDAALTTEPKP